jgi:DNA-binding NarL/FixJ family response regulator
MTSPVAPGTTVLLVDDHRLVRAGLRMLLDSTPDLKVIAEAANGGDAIRLAAEHHPDLILMDLRMPGVDGVEATRQITAAQPKSKVLVLTTFGDDDHLFPALAAGASGYLVKDTEPDDLIDAIRRTVDGDILFSPSVLRRLVERALSTSPSDRNTTASVDVTPRERDVLNLIGEGYGNQEIGDRLHLSVTTVKKHIAVLMDKTGCDNRVRLAVFAVRSS